MDEGGHQHHGEPDRSQDFSGTELTSLDQLPHDLNTLRLELSYNKLAAFTSKEPHVTHSAQQVIHFTAQHNRVTSLNGIGVFRNVQVLDLSHNSLRRVETRTLLPLQQLKQLLLGSNNISSCDLAIPTLEVLDLANNVLHDIPDLSGCTNLEHVFLDGNAIASLGALEEKLPESGVVTLSLQDNQLESWIEFVALTAFAERMTSVNVAGNPLMDVKFSCGAFASFLLPHLVHFNGKDITASDTHIASLLFKENGVISAELLKLMDDGREADLVQHLEAVTNDSISRRAKSAQQPAPTPMASASGAPDSSTTIRASDDDFSRLALKVKRMADVLKVLHQQDLSQRKHCASKLQRVGRAYTTRLLCFDALFASGGRRYADEVSSPSAPSAQVNALALRTDGLEDAVRSLWHDFGIIRSFVELHRNVAAKRIQRRYRGWKARVRFAILKRHFNAFKQQLQGPVLKVQATWRMYVARRKYLAQRREERRLRSMEGEIRCLKDQVDDLRSIVHALTAALRGDQSEGSILQVDVSDTNRQSE